LVGLDGYYSDILTRSQAYNTKKATILVALKDIFYVIFLTTDLPTRKKMIHNTKNITNNILAIIADAPAIPVKPRTPATIEITKKIKAHLSILLPPYLVYPNCNIC
jgi:hypothetical protein